MAEIIQFPTAAVRNSIEMKKVIKEYLIQYTDNMELIEHVVERVTNYIAEYLNPEFNFQMPSSMAAEDLEEFQKSLKKQVQDMINPIILERILTEMDLFKMKFEKLIED